ncbi:hypothetical protein CBER1_10704 [Cercospora berteroae]|uniref:C2H2 type master regulator of conidiophore development brlA n=1 Tax=Cercospora berteroae TaxID=357750 RepID=A0A2S6BYC4_9PEZI|nr:hypothetical protein CBER1_10704 [Cercospora berteroae]
MDTSNNDMDVNFDDWVNLGVGLDAPSQDQGQGSGEVLARPSSSENQGQDAASEAPERPQNVNLGAEEQEIVLTWEEFTQGVFAASDDAEGDVPAGVAPPSESQEAWGRSQGEEMEVEEVSGNGAQAVPTGLAPLLVYHQGYAQSQEEQQLSGIGAQFEPFDVASPPVYQQAYPQSQDYVSGNGAQYAAPGFPPLPAGLVARDQREGMSTVHFDVQQGTFAPPASAARAQSAPAGVAAPLAGPVASDQRAQIARANPFVDAAHRGGQPANLAPPLSANPGQFPPPGVALPLAGPSTWNQRVEALRVNARVNDVHFVAQQRNLAPSPRPARPATLAYWPHQNLPPTHQYGGQAVMVPGVPLAPAPAPVPASAPAPPVPNPFLPPVPAPRRRTGRGKGNPDGPQDFPCARCDFATGTKQKLVSHERIHFEPTHLCTFNGCMKRFWSEKDLKRHVDTHFPERAPHFTCGECGKVDKRKDNHNRHVETCNKGRKRDGEGRGEGGDGGI